MKAKVNLIKKVGGIESNKYGKQVWCSKHCGFVAEEKADLDKQGFIVCNLCRYEKNNH